VARKKLSKKESFAIAMDVIEHSRKIMHALRKDGIIHDPPG